MTDNTEAIALLPHCMTEALDQLLPGESTSPRKALRIAPPGVKSLPQQLAPGERLALDKTAVRQKPFKLTK
jgi:hypothetical protein